MGRGRNSETNRGGHLIAQDFLSRLDGVRQTGPDRWLAKCPAHADSSPSLNVKDVGGKLLVICRAGCAVQSILESTGLSWEVLFEEKPYAHHREVKKAFPASDVLKAIEAESMLVAVAASNLANGVALTNEDRKRLLLAAQRIFAAAEMNRGH